MTALLARQSDARKELSSSRKAREKPKKEPTQKDKKKAADQAIVDRITGTP